MHFIKLFVSTLSFSFFFLLLFPTSALALSCDYPPSAEVFFKQNDLVFSGKFTVTNVEGSDDFKSQEGYFKVNRVWKGNLEDIETQLFSATFWNYIENEKEYVIYSDRSDRTMPLSYCGRNKLVDSASGEKEIRKLNSLIRPDYIGAEAEENVTTALYFAVARAWNKSKWFLPALLYGGYVITRLVKSKKVSKNKRRAVVKKLVIIGLLFLPVSYVLIFINMVLN